MRICEYVYVYDNFNKGKLRHGYHSETPEWRKLCEQNHEDDDDG